MANTKAMGVDVPGGMRGPSASGSRARTAAAAKKAMRAAREKRRPQAPELDPQITAMADMNVEAEVDEKDPIKIEGVAPTKVKVAGADRDKAMAQSAPAAKTFGTQYKAMEGGKVRFSPKGDLYVYEYDPSTKTYTIVDHPQGKGVGATFGADHPSIAKFDESRMAAQQESGAAAKPAAAKASTQMETSAVEVSEPPMSMDDPNELPPMSMDDPNELPPMSPDDPNQLPPMSMDEPVRSPPVRSSSPRYGEGTIDDVIEAGPSGLRYGAGTIDDVVAAGPPGLSDRVPEAAPLIKLGLLNEAGEFDQAKAAVALARRDITASQLEAAKRALRAAGIAIRVGPMGAEAARRGGLSSGML